MKLHHLRNVVAVVERGSLRAGAKHLGLAQPAVSRSIKELEQELGLVLFERNKFGMTLTAPGAFKPNSPVRARKWNISRAKIAA
jgi:LysR family transcriptional regulator, regulator of abg operon